MRRTTRRIIERNIGGQYEENREEHRRAIRYTTRRTIGRVIRKTGRDNREDNKRKMGGQ